MKRLSALLAVAFLATACHGTLAGPPGNGAGVSPEAAGSAAMRGSPLKASRRLMPFKIVGSSNTVTADMPVPRPDTTPCTVTLFSNYAFKNFSNQMFSYTPPAKCRGPWAKAVLTFNVRVSKGVQYDRTGIIWVDGAVVYFGTTAEPSPDLAPHWSIQRDVTDLSALFKAPSEGQISLGNCYCPPDYTGIQYGTATLQFYPPDAKYPAPRVPDDVIGMPYSPPLGSSTQLPSSEMTVQTTLPRNIVKAGLDLYLQSQNDEEQWFMCVPNRVWNESQNELGFCPNTAFRIGEVSVDGKPAGIAPVYPWIYTGGIDPYLWFPLPGVQTLAFVPYRVDLTPFAGVLSGGGQQSIDLAVHNAFNYFTGAGDLLLYLDSKAKKVTGAVTSDTLTPSRQTVFDNITFGSGTGLFGGPTASGPVRVGSRQEFSITGYVNTSSGKVTTTVQQASTFFNQQNYTYTATTYSQLVKQQTTLESTTTTLAGSASTVREESYSYPLSVAYPISPRGKGYKLPIVVDQGYLYRVRVTGSSPSSSETSNTVQSRDTMIFNRNFAWVGVKNGASSQLYTYKDSAGTCYGRSIASVNNVVTSLTNPGCSASARH